MPRGAGEFAGENPKLEFALPSLNVEHPTLNSEHLTVADGGRAADYGVGSKDWTSMLDVGRWMFEVCLKTGGSA